MAQRTVYLHVGTHKTGTTSIQAMLAMNESALALAGTCVPRAGRPAVRWGTQNCGHHNLAWELNGLADFNPAEGSFDDAVAEIERSALPRAVISSEDLSFLRDKPGVLARMRDRVRSAGYETTVLVCLRPQPEYIQAIYTENAKIGIPVNYDAVLANIFKDGAWIVEHPPVICSVEYGPLLESFAAVYGRERVVVMPYRGGRGPSALLREFLELIGAGALPFESLLHPSQRNPSPTMRDVLDGLFATAARQMPNAETVEALAARILAEEDRTVLSERFDVMPESEMQAVIERFAADNAAVWERYGAGPPQRAVRPCSASSWRVVEQQRALFEAAMAAWHVVAGSK